MARVTLDGGQHRIFATGEITDASASDLIEFVERHGIDSARVVFNSPGGSLVGALKLGLAIRELGFDTEIGAEGSSFEEPVEATCASSCAYALSGGKNRYYGSRARLGVHQFYRSAGTGSLQDGQAISGLIVSYLTSMGVDAAAFALSTTAKSDEMRWLTESEAEQLGFVNNGTTATSVEIKLASGHPYLRIEQTNRDVTGRALLFCDGDTLTISVGVVTDPETSQAVADRVSRSYIEIDGAEIAPITGAGGTQAEGSVVWVRRDLPRQTSLLLTTATNLGVWTENGSAFRWGAQIDLTEVRSQVANFIENCRP